MDFLHFKAKKVIDIVLMDVVWAAYYICSNWMIAKTGSAFVTGMILRASALVFLIVYILIKKEVLPATQSTAFHRRNRPIAP